MIDSRPRTPRTLLIPDHLWQAFDEMASEMGTDREGLISQALYTFARLNGFLVPHDLAALGLATPQEQARPSVRPAPHSGAESHVPPAEFENERLVRPAPSEPAPSEPDSLEPAPSQPESAAAPDVGGGVEVDDSLLGDDGIQATSMELPNLAAMGLMPGRPGRSTPPSEDPAEVAPAADQEREPPVLVLLADGRELDRVVKDRFLIGRGKHCDLIINSGKVSREHAAITHEGPNYFIEDLGSSNGTWFDKRRIGKKQIVNGDEYFICAEKLTCQLV